MGKKSIMMTRIKRVRKEEKMFKKILARILAAVLAAGMTGGTGMTVRAVDYVDTSSYESLAEVYEDYFRIGVSVQAIDHWNDPTAEIGNAAKEDLINRSFNSMTFGNELKPAYNFDPKSPTLFSVDRAAEELLTYAKDNGIPVRGHVLVWHSQVNPAIFARDFMPLSGGKPTRDEKAVLDEDCLVERDVLIDRLRTYIYGALEYTYSHGFADVIYAWDVVNEASEEKEPDGLRRSYWYKIIGPEFLYYSFLFTREAVNKYSLEYASEYGLDPKTDDLSVIRPLLFYNDYNEWYESRSNAIIRFLTEDVYNKDQSMIESDAIAPGGDGTIFGDGLVDGIGMQGHLSDTQNLDQYMRALEKYNDAAGLVHITELDVGKTGSGSAGEANQAVFYHDFFSRLVEEVKQGVNLTSVTFWGLTDDASWRHGADPLLFRGNLETKPAFDAVLKAGKGRPFEPAAYAVSAGTGEEKIDFEPYKENGTTVTVPPEAAGFFSRGTGHQSTLVLVPRENHTPEAPIGFSLRVQRSEQDATVRKEINSRIGTTFQVTMYVKTKDTQITLGVEGPETIELLRVPSDGEWVELNTVCTVPKDWQSASLYIETDGTQDILIDDILIKNIQGNAD